MIESLNLTKYYGKRCVVDNVSFQVKPGEILGFLGPNGAGKSTTMKMITGFLNPSSGSARINGIDVAKDPISARSRLGYLPENGPLYEEMTVEEFLKFISGIRNGDKTSMDQAVAVELALRTCQLEDVRKQTIDTLSKGFHQRVGVAQAILHDPDYLILDEPTDGLDPNQKNEIRSLLKQMASSKAIILSTHILEEVEAICNRVIIVANGKLIVDEDPASLKKRHKDFGAYQVQFKSLDNTIESSFKERFANGQISLSGNALTLRTDGNSDPAPDIFSLISEHKWEVETVAPLPTPLDQVFKDLTLAA